MHVKAEIGPVCGQKITLLSIVLVNLFKSIESLNMGAIFCHQLFLIGAIQKAVITQSYFGNAFFADIEASSSNLHLRPQAADIWKGGAWQGGWGGCERPCCFLPDLLIKYLTLFIRKHVLLPRKPFYSYFKTLFYSITMVVRSKKE